MQHGQLRKAQGIDYMVKPPIQAPAGTKSYEVDLLPGGLSVTNMSGPNSGIKTAFEVRLDLSGQLEDIRDVRERIRSATYADLFLMIAMDEKNQPDTARAIAEKHEEKMLMLGPVLERLHNELLKPFIDITFDKMLAANIVPPPPKEMHGQELSIEFVSMLAQAQRAIGTQNIDRYMQSMGMVAQFRPDVLDKLDTDKWADKYADMLGVEPDLIVGSEQVALIRQQRAKQQAAQQQMAAAEQMANTAKAASQAQTTQPSALTDLMSSLTGYSGPGPSNTI
jgi:DNA primase